MSTPDAAALRIETARLILRPLSMADIDDVWEYASDPLVTRFTRFDHHTRKDVTRQWLASALEGATGDNFLFGLEHRELRHVIGGCAIRACNKSDSHAEMGWALARAHWHQGYGTEAVRGVIGFGFEQLRLNRLEARCIPAHTASRRLMEKCGMRFEGVLRQAEFFKNAFQDLALYSILKQEWAASGDLSSRP
ncbi:MAG: GNAT family N-acetyltransferase [Acidobacteria bacterium]|nr:GNAT family N-acetyltransferase [Acidobacteriota bacterium]